MNRQKTRRDLTGMRFGKLTVESVDEERSKEGKVYWWCTCDCGNRKSVQSTSLTRKKNGIKSCGCNRNSREAVEKARVTRNSYPIDITGYRFGKLKVIEKTNIRPERAADNGAFLWKCICDCGNICYYSRYSLIGSNGVQSCGCLYKENRGLTYKKYNKYDLENYDFGIGYCDNGTYLFFDKEDYEKIKNYSWSYDGHYVSAHTLKNDDYTTKFVRLHRIVMDINDREYINVDHINHITYDCRKINLRRADNYQNAHNVDHSAESACGITGVFKLKNKWISSIMCQGEKINLGSFNTIDEAVSVRKDAEIRLFKEFRYDPESHNIIDESKILGLTKLQKAV